MKRTTLLLLLCLALPSQKASAATSQPLTIIYFQDKSTPPLEVGTQLEPLLALYHKAKEKKRFIITSYAALPSKPSWAAFRLSLTRALTLRTYLTSKGVESKHIVLHPKGNVCSAPCQRANIVLQ